MLKLTIEFRLPEEAAWTTRTAFPSGNNFMKLRDDLAPIFENKHFVRLLPTIGRPAEYPRRLALVSIENLTNRQAMETVHSLIEWKW